MLLLVSTAVVNFDLPVRLAVEKSEWRQCAADTSISGLAVFPFTIHAHHVLSDGFTTLSPREAATLFCRCNYPCLQLTVSIPLENVPYLFQTYSANRGPAHPV